MTRSNTRWMRSALILTAASGLLGMAASRTAGVTAEAYGVYANSPTGSQAKAPIATVPAGGGMGDAEALSVGVSGVVQAENLLAIATGAGDASDVSAEASSVAERITLLNGLITAEGLVALSSSALHGTVADASGAGSHFLGLVVSGVALPDVPAPDTRVNLPGVGYVILNEQSLRGDGVNSIGLTVTMIHVVLEQTVIGLLGGTTTVQVGEIIVGSATSSVTR
jgi:hypothetical protein